MINREIESNFSVDLDFLRWLQLSTYIRSQLRIPTLILDPSTFEHICLKGESLKHSLSYLYALLIEIEAPHKLPFLQCWERDMGVSFSQAQKDRILFFSHKASLASRYQEGGYKILTRWYRTPTALHWIFPQVSDVCWRCQESEGTMIHIFWECQMLREFWKMVEETVETTTGVSLGENPAAFLLHDIPLSNDKYKNLLLKHLLTAAKACIPVFWKSNVSPTRLQWMARVSEIQQMEDLTMLLKEQEKKYWKIWNPYFQYREQTLLSE